MGTLFNSEENQLSGLGGWLVLVGIGIVLSPLRIATQTVPMYLDIFRSGVWGALTSPDSPNYHPLWAPLLLGEMATNLAMIIAWILVAILFFSKKRVFPRCYIGLMLFTLGFQIVNAAAIQLVLPNETVFDQETTLEIGRTAVAAAVWIPYLLMSERVRNTFVEPIKASQNDLAVPSAQDVLDGPRDQFSTDTSPE